MENVEMEKGEKVLVGGKDYVTCQLCKIKLRNLRSHLVAKHKITPTEYHKKFPGWLTIIPSIIRQIEDTKRKNVYAKYGVEAYTQLPENRRKNSIGGKRVWAKRDKNFREERQRKIVSTCLERYDSTNPFNAPALSEVIHGNQKKALLDKYGVTNSSQIPGVAEDIKIKREKTIKKRYGVDNIRQIPGVNEKILLGTKRRPTQPELKLVKLLPKFVKYAGDGRFWVRMKDSSCKNPDFVVRPFRKWKKVIEMFGVYYHKPEEESIVIEKYKEVGVSCLVIWEDKLKDVKKIQEQVAEFLSRSSETTREAPVEVLERQDEDIVHSL